MSSDADLLRQYCATQSEAAFAELVRRHLNLVYFAAMRRTGGNGALAQEITQDVFTVLATRAGSLVDHATLAGWLYTTTRFAAAKAVRTEQRRKNREQAAHLMNEPNDGTTRADWERLRPLLDEALDQLNDRERQAVLLRCLEDRPFAEIGATLRLSEDAARRRVDRALTKLNAMLARRGVASTSAALGLALANQALGVVPPGLAANVTVAALSGAAAGGSSAAVTTLSLMSSTKVLAAGGVIAALLAVGGFLRNAQAAKLAADCRVAQREQTQAAEALRDLQRRVSVTEIEATARAGGPAAVTGPETAPAAAAGAAPTRGATTPEIYAALGRTSPEFVGIYLQELRLRFELKYRPLFQSLALSAELQQRFHDLVAERARAGDWWGWRVQRSESKFIEDLRRELGNEAAERYHQFEQTINAREWVNEASANLFYLDAPLTQPQAERLVAIIAEASPSYRNGEKYIAPSTIEWDRVLAEAASLVSPTQLSGLRSVAARSRMDALLRAAASAAVSFPTK